MEIPSWPVAPPRWSMTRRLLSRTSSSYHPSPHRHPSNRNAYQGKSWCSELCLHKCPANLLLVHNGPSLWHWMKLAACTAISQHLAILYDDLIDPPKQLTHVQTWLLISNVQYFQIFMGRVYRQAIHPRPQSALSG